MSRRLTRRVRRASLSQLALTANSRTLLIRELVLALLGAGVRGYLLNIGPVKPFETVLVIKG